MVLAGETITQYAIRKGISMDAIREGLAQQVAALKAENLELRKALDKQNTIIRRWSNLTYPQNEILSYAKSLPKHWTDADAAIAKQEGK